MFNRTTIMGLCALAVVVGSVAIARSQDPDDGSERARASTLKLGEELPPPRPIEDQFTKILVEASVGDVMKQTGPTFQRDQHPKHHGCVRATFTVLEGLPAPLRAGVFREPRTYDAVVRFSNGKEKVDNVKDAHGMAIKLLGVEGPSLLEGEADAGTQDFIMIDHPVFFAIDPKDLVEFVGVTKGLEAAKKAGDTAKAGAILKEFGARLAFADAFKKLGTPSPLEMTYFSEVPYRLGDRAIKFSAVPGPENASGREPLTETSPEDALRQAMVEHLTTKARPATFRFEVRLQTDPVKMPVENPMVPWESEPIAVATLTIKPQEFARTGQLDFCENLSFTPWHSSEAHRPIGGINRARKPVYQATSIARHEKNRVPRKEPTTADLDRLFPTGPER